MKGAWLAACAALFSGCAATELAVAPEPVGRHAEAEAAIENWTEPSRLQARALLDEYGAPEVALADLLTWRGHGPWDRLSIWNAPVGEGAAPTLEGTVGYPLTRENADKIRDFDARMACDVGAGRLSARAESEQADFLLLNLADDVANARKTPEQARIAYREILDRSYSGKSSPYLRGLLFRFGSR